MPYLNLVLTLVLMLAVAVVAAQNPGLVVTKFLALRSVELPLGLVMMISACLGAVTVGITSLLFRQRSGSVVAQQIQSRLEDLENLERAQPDPTSQS